MKELKNKLGVLGGLFDPIHYGHLSLCRQIREKLSLAKVIFVPTYNPPHKTKCSDFEHRMKMTELSIAEIPEFEASALEAEITGPSYTIKMLEKVKLHYPEFELYFIIGSDNLAKMEEWYQPDLIFSLAQVVMGNRPGPDGSLTGKYEQKLLKLEIEPTDISSTQIRAAVKAGANIKKYLPTQVADYIIKEGLYV